MLQKLLIWSSIRTDFIVILLILILTSGCVKNRVEFCEVVDRPICISHKDTEETKKEVAVLNEIGLKFCNWSKKDMCK